MMKATSPFIYGLIDPRERWHLRYIGMTMKNAKRPNDHRYWTRHTTKGKNRYIANWVRKLHREGVAYTAVIIEKCPTGSTVNFVYGREQHYILVARKNGHKLTNATDGGPGTYGHKLSEDHRAALSAAKKGKPLSERQRAANTARRGKPPSEKQCAANTARRGKPLSNECREALSASHKGKILSKEHRSALSLAKKGKSLSEEHRVAIGVGLKNSLSAKVHHTTLSKSFIGKPGPNLGKKFSDEHKSKISVAGKASWAKKKVLANV